MADPEQVLQDKMAITRASRALGVDMPIAPARPGDDGGETPLSEYLLQFQMDLVPLEDVWGQAIEVWGQVWSGAFPVKSQLWPPASLHKTLPLL